jgi:hypothetical protein
LPSRSSLTKRAEFRIGRRERTHLSWYIIGRHSRLFQLPLQHGNPQGQVLFPPFRFRRIGPGSLQLVRQVDSQLSSMQVLVVRRVGRHILSTAVFLVRRLVGGSWLEVPIRVQPLQFLRRVRGGLLRVRQQRILQIVKFLAFRRVCPRA